MKLINNILYISFAEMVECGVSEKYLSKAKSVGTRCWVFVSDPVDRRKVLIDHEKLRPMYQKMVYERYGNPYEHVCRQPILAMVKTDWAAHEYYKGYRYESGAHEMRAGNSAESEGGGGRYLPISTVHKYTRAASWLGMLAGVDKQLVKSEIGLSLATFYKHTGELIGLERTRGTIERYEGTDILPGDFPGTYQRLLGKVNAFVDARYNGGNEAAYQLIIDPMFGNKRSAKIGKQCGNSAIRQCDNVEENAVIRQFDNVNSPFEGGRGMSKLVQGDNEMAITPKTTNKTGGFDPELYERQMAVIRTIAAKHNNFDAAQVTEMANTIFSLNNWSTIKVGTVRAIIKKNAHLLTAGRKGRRAHDSTVAMQVKRKVTELPLMYWTLDGWTVELLYQEKSGERGAKSVGSRRVEYERLVVVIVLDAWMKYPVGYAIGERETPELIREANRNALLHVRELFGGMYRPVQVQSDNYQIKNLTPFYQAMSHLHTPAAVGNAKSKIIEPYFKYLNKTYCQKLPNWTGFNINASKKNQVNTEMLDKIKNTFPDKAGVAQQIATIIERERGAKRDAYVSKWSELAAEHKHTMTVMQWLEIFGAALGKTNRIKGEGLVKRINNAEFVYDSFDPAFRANMHTDWQLIGDLTDLSHVLAVSVDGRMKFVLEQKRVLPMDVASTTAEDMAYRQRITAYNKTMQQQITDLYGRDADIARDVINNTPLDLSNEDELALKVMLTYNGQQKERLQDARGLATNSTIRQFDNSTMRECEHVPMRQCDSVKVKNELVDEWAEVQDRRMEGVVDFSVFEDSE